MKRTLILILEDLKRLLIIILVVGFIFSYIGFKFGEQSKKDCDITIEEIEALNYREISEDDMIDPNKLWVCPCDHKKEEKK